ncbi:MAG TPA: phage tail protein [Streptosporangiaceae bacterium]|jgi:phage tail-like protein
MTLPTALARGAINSALDNYPSFGMAMRFQVAVGAVHNVAGTPGSGVSLGLWQGCRGLQFEMTYKAIESGGVYDEIYQLPERIKWSPVTLERAVQQNASLAIWQWLKICTANWSANPSSAQDFDGQTNVSITLLDYQSQEVLTWILQDARPVKWEGPTLNAEDKKVAIEKLTIEHQGIACEKISLP